MELTYREFKENTFVKGNLQECLQMLEDLRKAEFRSIMVEGQEKNPNVDYIWYWEFGDMWVLCDGLTEYCVNELTQSELYKRIEEIKKKYGYGI